MFIVLYITHYVMYKTIKVIFANSNSNSVTLPLQIITELGDLSLSKISRMHSIL